MTKIEQIIDGLLGREGGYVNHPDDRGGETIWGITVGTARANGYQASMRHMTREQAREIYRNQYWRRPGFDKIEPIYSRVADELFDTGVNMGPAVAVRFLQRLLNVMADSRLAVDGQLGPATRTALSNFKLHRKAAGEEILIRGLDALQGARYIELVEQRSRNRSFVYGWFAHRLENA